MDQHNLPLGTSPPRLAVKAKLASRLNLAAYQNAVPLLSELIVSNHSEHTVESVQLSIAADPPYLSPRTILIDSIPPQSDYPITDRDLSLDGHYLRQLNEAELATLSLSAHVLAFPDHAATEQHRVTLLPKNHWQGITNHPQLLAAYVQPNEPSIAGILKSAAAILEQAGQSTSLDGESASPDRIWQISSALWLAFSQLRLTYALPPPSFENTGQKVRSATQILQEGIATCLDLTLLFASALELAGIRPVIVVQRGHAFPGCWLKPVEIDQPIVDDPASLRNRLQLKHLILFEATLLTDSAVAFTTAIDRASRSVAFENDHDFEFILDIHRCRLNRIKPLNHEYTTPQVTPLPATPLPATLELAPADLSGSQPLDTDPATLSPKDRIDLWQRKLLDLSLRNPLLNFRATKKSVKLLAPDPARLEDLLAASKTFRLLPQADFLDAKDPRDATLLEDRERLDAHRERALEALTKDQIFAALDKASLEAVLIELFRSARTSLEESGSNTLYLALGFLHWVRDGKRYRAPLILIPVSLSRASVVSGFRLTAFDDEPRLNPALLEMLRRDFNLAIDISDTALPKDESGLDIAQIWKRIRQSISDCQGWEVAEDVVLAHFSFAKYLMWKDLVDRNSTLRDSNLVRHLIDSPRTGYPSTEPFIEPTELDSTHTPHETFCPLPADSSQLSAILTAAKGKDFVLIGPPGTGKSQTIANLIAQTLANSKRVLFVAEKVAALNVVFDRLKQIGLGEFCLELHSSKASRARIVGQLRDSWTASGELDSAEWHAQANELARLRDALNDYVKAIHTRYPNGLTIQRAIGIAAANQDTPRLPFSWPSHTHHAQADFQALIALAEHVQLAATNTLSQLTLASPLRTIGLSDWSATWQQQLFDLAQSLHPSVATTTQHLNQLFALSAFPAFDPNNSQRLALCRFFRSLFTAHGKNWSFILRPDRAETYDALHAGMARLNHHRALTESLSPPWPPPTQAKLNEGLDWCRQRLHLLDQLPEAWPSAVQLEAQRAARSLDRCATLRSSLSITYQDSVFQVDASALLLEWNLSAQSIWPLSALRHRKIRKQLLAHSAGSIEINAAADLPILAELRQLRAELDTIQLPLDLVPFWRKSATNPTLLAQLLQLQQALHSCRTSPRVAAPELPCITGGECGIPAMEHLSLLAHLQTLAASIESLPGFDPSIRSVWRGLETSPDLLAAALDFQRDKARVEGSGKLLSAHPLIADGSAGHALKQDHDALTARAALEDELDDSHRLTQATQSLWQGLATSPSDVAGFSSFYKSFIEIQPLLYPSPAQCASFLAALDPLLTLNNSALSPTAPLRNAFDDFQISVADLDSRTTALASTAQMSVRSVSDLQHLNLTAFSHWLAQLESERGLLVGWCDWLSISRQADAHGLLPLTAAVQSGTIAATAVLNAFHVNYSRWWLNLAVDSSPVVRTFVPAAHDERIRKFIELDDRLAKLSSDYIRASLRRNIPRYDGNSIESQWATLKHETNKKSKHLPLRELMTRIPDVVTRLTPCFLMSPLSIAQYLNASPETFDLVVFDEASQIPVWDAIGAMARGKHVVVVGDPKQLPPTSFFDRTEEDDPESELEQDMESILDECTAANLPLRDLKWHYRSRHESLITFSNHRYYNNSLITFPSPATEDRAVSLHQVDGTYERGGSRTNPIEAKAVVQNLIAVLRSASFEAKPHSIGIVTLNAEQQRLIEDLLDQERRIDQSLEPYFDTSRPEPIFVKNLESVQGDERDLMYLSIGYGPDSHKNLSMNFGPMNKAGGWRRLNVAITRARIELKVFCSFSPDMLDLNRTKAQGLADLRQFLDFARRGISALALSNTLVQADFESPFEQAVAAALTTRGWQLRPQVGVSVFRVDLGVIHPTRPGTYLAGIECDGATYHRSATARDRDKVRQGVLEGLGWHILRVWSPEWWNNPSGVTDKLDQALRRLQAD